MHILIDGRVITDHFPGIGRYTYHLTGALADRDDVEITLLIDSISKRTRYDLDALAKDHPRLKLQSVPIPTFSRQEQTHLPKFIRSLDFDLYHAQHYVLPYFGWRKPVVVTLHDLIPMIMPKYWSMKTRLAYPLMNRLAIRAAKKISVPSIATQNDLVRLFGVKSDRVCVIPEAVDARFHPAPIDQVQTLRSKYQLPEKYLLFVGINKPHKNVARLIEAYARVVQRGTEYDLVVAGAWDDRYPEVKQKAAELNLSSRIHFIKSISDVELPVLYSSASVFVTASLYEGFGLPILEAMACGTPVISSNASSLPEVVGEAGLLFDPLNLDSISTAIQQITSDSNLQMNLKQRGLDRAKEFTWARTAEETMKLYSKIVQ